MWSQGDNIHKHTADYRYHCMKKEELHMDESIRFERVKMVLPLHPWPLFRHDGIEPQANKKHNADYTVF